MATRTGAGTGVVVGLVVFVLATVFLLVLTIVFYSRQQDALEARDRAMEDLNAFATRAQRTSEQIKAVRDEARPETVVNYLMDKERQIMTKAVGNPSGTMEDIDRALGRGGNNAPNLVSALEQVGAEKNGAMLQVEGLEEQVRQQEELIASQKALLDQAEESRKQSMQEIRDSIQSFINDVQTYAGDVQDTKKRMMDSLREVEQNFNAQVDHLEAKLDTIQVELSLRDQQLALYREQIAEIRQLGKEPHLLVDGMILENPDNQDRVFINRGRVDHVALGMTFEVYDDPSMLAPAPDGTLPRGKASIEVLKVGETTSTAKITRGSRARPVVRGDVLANAVYDPKKTFKFLVHGKFDLNGDGRPSESETQLVKSLIENWGGEIVPGDQIRGDIDYLLLGTQPTLPPDLPTSPSAIQVQIWTEQRQAYDKYQQLLNDAMRAYIPVLNQNRFLILIGHTYD